MGYMDVNDTVHTVRLRFDYKMLSHSEKIAPCERAFTLPFLFLHVPPLVEHDGGIVFGLTVGLDV